MLVPWRTGSKHFISYQRGLLSWDLTSSHLENYQKEKKKRRVKVSNTLQGLRLRPGGG
ncbi:Hypothetical predicted protein [Marmota monax]|uniref:Uncharacterized protein n=1 Tax=Marmota monax TaxID=9995 RepID=A0A5E4ALQ0_MARMO|nr:Hypothetical predicted protein [Marmota monax]